MVQNNTKFDIYKDVQEVDQFGYVDLVKAFQNGYVPGDVDFDELSFNDIEDPSSIVGKPHDAFEAMRMQDAIVKHATKVRGNVPAKESVSTENS